MGGTVQLLLQDALDVVCPSFVEPEVRSVRVCDAVAKPGVRRFVHDDVDERAVAREKRCGMSAASSTGI